MAKGWRVPLVAAALGAGVGSVVFAPARWWAVVVDHTTQGRVQLQYTQGTVWRGRADVILTGDGGVLRLPGGLAWDWGWTATPRPAVTVTLTLPCCATSPWVWRLTRSDTGWMVTTDAQRLTADLAWLSALGSPWNTLGLQGTVVAEIEPVRWPLGTATVDPATDGIRWTARVADLSSTVATVRPLGSYRLEGAWTPVGGPTLTLSTLSGDLRLEGSGGWERGRFRFQGLAQATPQRLEALSNLLNLLGRRDGDRAHLKIG